MSMVLLVAGSGERAGAERVLLTLAAGLPAEGHEAVVCCLADGPFVDEVAASGVPVLRRGSIPRVRELWRLPGAVAQIAGAARETSAALVQGTGERVCVFSGLAARRAGCRSVHWLHDAPLRSAAATAVQVAMASSPHDAVVAPAGWMARAFHRHLGLDVRHIPNGIELDALPIEPADVRALAGWPPATMVVAHFGRLQRWKGAETFLHAAARVAAAHPEARFLVAGGALYGWEESYARGLPGLADQLGLGDRAHFTGHRDDALELMAGCDVVVHCSTRPEPFPTVVVEAMALGRAIVATRTGGPEELLTDRVTGMLVAPGEPAAMATAIHRLLADPFLRAAQGGAARASAERSLSAATMCARFAGLYAELGVGAGVPRRVEGC